MPYLSATPWSNLLPGVGTLTGSSTPLTIDEVATIISRTSAEMDSALAQAGYVTPVSTTATGYGYLEEICNYGAGWKVLRGIFPNFGGPGDNISLASEWRDAYQNALTAIRGGDIPIIGATLDTTETVRLLPRSYSTSNPGATAGVLPEVDMDTVF